MKFRKNVIHSPRKQINWHFIVGTSFMSSIINSKFDHQKCNMNILMVSRRTLKCIKRGLKSFKCRKIQHKSIKKETQYKTLHHVAN